jgi:predicted TIM-barrel fold metal-dependent hydrolase
MDEDGVDMSVALNIGWSSSDICSRTNDYILDVASHYPNRIIPFCMVQPAESEVAVREIERCAKAGARGLGELRPDLQGYTLSDEVLAPIVEAAMAFELTILPHVSEPMGHQYPGKGVVKPEQAYDFAIRYPDARLVCAHWGGGLPFYALMPEVGRALGNVYFDTAASHYLYQPAVFKRVCDLVGAEKILFGSDYPLIKQSRAIAETERAHLAPVQKAAILGNNAARLLALRPTD